MSEFTKGEWSYSVLAVTQTPATLFVKQDGQEIDIAVFEKWEQDWAKEEMQANARLIADAPKTKAQRDKLLEKCKMAKAWFDKHTADEAVWEDQPSTDMSTILDDTIAEVEK